MVIIFENHNLSLGKFSSLPNVLEEFGSWFGALVRGQYLGHCLVSSKGLNLLVAH